MNPLYYWIIVNIILLMICMKLIFKTPNIFLKSIWVAIFRGDLFDTKKLQKWEEENNLSHKMNLFLAAIMGISGSSFIIYNFFL